MEKRWNILPFDNYKAEQLKQSLGISLTICKILVQRGIDNFEEALNISTGDYFIILGDDDSTTKDILSIVEWMERENIESVSSSFVVDYIWPNDQIEKYRTGYLTIPNYKGDVRKINVDRKAGVVSRIFI